MGSKLENEYQAGLIDRIKTRFPETAVLKNDEQYIQGIPDLTVLLPNGRWAVLEVKAKADSPKQPNQDYYINWFNERGFAAFIHPGNEEEVLNALQRSFEV